MPRKRASTQEPPRKRNRTGCDKCRSRKVRCDETKPVCGQCLAKGYACETTIKLKWEQDYVNVGRAFGRTGIWGKKAERTNPASPCANVTEDVPWCRLPLISAYSFINATVGDVEQLTTLEDDETSHDISSGLDIVRATDRDDTASTASLSPWLSKRQPVPLYSHNPLPLSLPVLPHLQDPMHSNLLSYFLERLCPMTVPSSASKSPFATLILPFSISSSPAVLDSLLALAACHRSKSDPFFRPAALKLGDKVLRTLRSRLSNEDPNRVALDPETLVIMMILCQYEIINECDKRWVVHLKGARDLIRVRRNAQLSWSSAQDSKELIDFAERYFAFQDVIGRTACGEEPIFGSDFWTSRGEETDAWLGCSVGLVSIICDVTELSRQHRADPSIALSPEFQSQAVTLERRLSSVKQRVFDEDDDLLQMSAELKRMSAELYLHCALNGANPSMSLVIVHIRQILRLVYVLLEHDVLAGLSWPIFVAAVELEPTGDLEWTEQEDVAETISCHARPFILQALNRIGGSIANVTKTRSVIEKVWQTREHNAFADSQKPSHETGQNDWERFVAPFCGGMSLA